MTAIPTLPQGFEALQPFVGQWSRDTLSARDTARLDSSPDERRAFYDAAGALAPAALDYLDARALDSFNPGERALMNLMLSLIHVALAVELQGAEEPVHAFGARRMPILRGHADRALAASA